MEENAHIEISHALMKAEFSELLCVGMALADFRSQELADAASVKYYAVYNYRTGRYQPRESDRVAMLTAMEKRRPGTLKQMEAMVLAKDIENLRTEITYLSRIAEKYQRGMDCLRNSGFNDVMELLEAYRKDRDKLELAVSDLHGKCSVCENYSTYHNRGPCRTCIFEPASIPYCEGKDNWRWRSREVGYIDAK